MKALFSRNQLILVAGYLALIVIAPFVSPKGYWLSLLCQIGIENATVDIGVVIGHQSKHFIALRRRYVGDDHELGS